ncbi:MAG: hypothetical protein ACRC41_14705 [Sarcina sp.]
MSEQIFYLEEKISDIVDDFIEVLTEDYSELLREKNLTKEAIINDIIVTKHQKCFVPKGIPFFEIASTVSETEESIAIECHCCGEILYNLNVPK